MQRLNPARWLVAGLFVLLAAPRAAALFAGGVSAEISTVEDQTIWVEGLKFSTPRDFSRNPGGAEYNLSATPAPPPFEAIQRITLSKLLLETIGSEPGAMECYALGTVRRPIPPPPDWIRSSDQIPPWTRPLPTVDLGQLPFINQAIFCWPGDAPNITRGEQVYLFRQNLEVRDLRSVARATLRVALNGRPAQAFFNQRPLHLGSDAATSIFEFEVTPLLREGKNLFAIQVEELPAKPELRYGLSLHLELQRRDPGSAAPPPVKPAAALLTTDSGDRLWGDAVDLQGDRVVIQSRYGTLTTPSDEIQALLFPAGWQPAPPRRGMLQSLAPQSSPADGPFDYTGLPLQTYPNPIQDSLLLTDARLTTAKPAYERAGVLHFEGYEGAQYSMPTRDVLGIYPPLPLDAELKRPDDDSAQLYARVETRSGERLSGLVRSLTGARLVLESGAGDFLTIPADALASIYFPYHALKLNPSAPQKIAILPQAPGQEALQPRYKRDSVQVQSAAFAIGAEGENLGFDTISDPAQLRPQIWPVLVSIDPLGEYLHTFKEEADARNALAQYVEDGGIVIALSRGGAFRTAVKNTGERMARIGTEPPLAEALGLTIVRPSGPAVAGVTAFDHPPNSIQPIFFQRGSRMPQGLLDLPRRIPLAPMVSAPYFPMVEQTGAGTVIYSMSDEGGLVQGPVLMLAVKGRGTVMVVDHLLWDSRPDDRPFAESILPSLLRWALANATQ